MNRRESLKLMFVGVGGALLTGCISAGFTDKKNPVCLSGSCDSHFSGSINDASTFSGSQDIDSGINHSGSFDAGTSGSFDAGTTGSHDGGLTGSFDGGITSSYDASTPPSSSFDAGNVVTCSL